MSIFLLSFVTTRPIEEARPDLHNWENPRDIVNPMNYKCLEEGRGAIKGNAR